jgi:hypothetical protein
MSHGLIGILISALFSGSIPAVAQDFYFDSAISRPVLENYLSRSISFTELGDGIIAGCKMKPENGSLK